MTTAFAGAVLDADGRPFDRIRLTGLSATGHHGVFEHEKVEGQLFRADVVLHLDTRAAASGDDLAQTVSYAGVAEDVVAVLAGSPADLVETVAERIAATILTHDEVVAVDVAVHKPQAPITVPFEDVEVVIRRDRVVVPVVAPLSRRSEQHGVRDAQLVAPIPVGSVAPALIHGVGDAPVAEERVELAPAPDVMPPSIPPGTTPVPVEPPSPDSEHEVAGGSADLDDERDATREAPAVPGPVAPAHEETTGPVPAPEAPAPAPEPVPAPYDALLEAAALPAPSEPSAEGLPGAVPVPVSTAPEQPGPVPAAAPLAEHAPEPVQDQAAAADPLATPFEPAYEPTYEGHGDAVPEAPVTPVPVAAALDAGAPVATSEEQAAPVAAEEEVPAPPVEHDRMDDVPAGFVEVVLALGANLGDAQQTLRDAITDLDRISGLEITEVSPLARTAAVGGPDQPDFLNTVLLARTRLSARDLLRACQAVEQAHGRVRDERWGPRTLDVDLIVYGTLTAVADDLELPHPRAHERAFVLEPWSQIDPDAVLPGLGGGPVAALAATAPDRGGIRWLALDWLTDAAPEPTGAVPVATGGSDAAPAPAPADPVVVDDPYRQPSADAVPGPHEAPSTSGAVGVPAVPEDVPAPAAPQHPPVPSQAPHQALPQRPPAPQQPLPAQPVPPQEPSAPGAVLPVAPPQAAVPPQAAPAEARVVRPVFAPVSEGVASSVEGAPTVVPDGSFGTHEAGSPAVAPFPGPSHRPPALPDPEPPVQDAVLPPEQGAPAFPAFAPVRPAEPPVAAHPAGAPPVAVPHAQTLADPATPADDGIIRSVPFAPVQPPVQQSAQQSAEASAPGPLADASLHPATDPWPPFGPVSGAARDAQR
ncbi:2-amino-4-hydroxy-6-hydroxymethyldihydropteridine diphosphokinase [Cellulosimicrobium sp. NPDC057862]|uniref:2-amino-4-hydroxy-6- hydroxymethyldihydropteridine diphosphokinase n=1 Tax=Cellulosimicrobium sp. NPDC057862 TaxID=3346266 RepID=UPI00366CC40B